MMRELLENTEKTFSGLVDLIGASMGIINANINDTATENGITLSDLLAQPWNTVAGEGGAIAAFGQAVGGALSEAKAKASGGEEGGANYMGDSLTAPWSDALAEDGPIKTFDSDVGDVLNNAKAKATGGKDGEDYMGDSLTRPWADATEDSEDNPLMTFDDKVGEVLAAAQDKATGGKDGEDYMGNSLTKPWEDAVGEGSPIATFASEVGKALDDAIKVASEKVPLINAEFDKINYPDYQGGGDGSGGGGGGGGGSKDDEDDKKNTSALQQILNKFFGTKLSVDGKLGPLTKAALKVAQAVLKVPVTGKYDKATYDALMKYLNKLPVGQWFKEKGISIPAPMYAKGTLSTKQSGFAITDESWIGEEITLAAGKSGQLQYLRKGSAVMPADISANLVEWGKLNPNMMNIGATPNINMISNAINKPEFNMSFDSLVHVDHCDEGTLRDLEKMVDTKINQFSKQMNYAIKKVGGR
jgi:hypothetical protein